MIERPKIHPTIIAGFSLFTILFVLFSGSWTFAWFFSLLMFILLRETEINWRELLKSLKFVIPMLGSVLLLNIIFGNRNFFQLFVLTNRLFLMFFISYASSLVVDWEKLILFFMSKNKLSKALGYPILIGLNSMTHLKQELEKIEINFKFKGIEQYKKIYMLFPLLVYAIRHSQRGAMALVSRGLNEDKKFYFNYDLNEFDRKILSSYGAYFFFLFAFYLVI